MTEADRRFMRHIAAHLREYGFRLIYGRGETVNAGGYRIPAYMDDANRIVRVARKARCWFQNLVHEYAHFLQWLDGARVFTGSAPHINRVDRWLGGKDCDAVALRRSFRAIRDLEMDCERRTVELIRRHGLSIDVRRYTKHAHLYIYGHYLMEQTRKPWPFSRSIYRSRRLVEMAPSTFRVRSHRRIPRRMRRALEAFAGIA